MDIQVNPPGKPPEDITHFYDHLRPEHLPRMTLEEAKEHISKLQRSTKLIGVAGQYRLDVAGTGRPVRLIEETWKQHYKEDGSLGCRESTDYWLCEDVLTGERRQVYWLGWGHILSEMEVLAWLS